jgi:hypothetical protein
MHEHREANIFAGIVAHGQSIYSGKCHNKHVTIVDAKGKRVEGIGEKLEVCAVFFDKLYNYAPVVKLPAEAKPEESRPPLEPPPHLGSPPLYSSAWAQGSGLRACLCQD